MFNFGGTTTEVGRPANFIPFKSILSYLLGERGILMAFLNIGGNIILLIPVGILAVIIQSNITWKGALLWAICSGLLIEGLQVILNVGIFDIDDLILNGLGVMIGYWILKIGKNLKKA